MEAALVRMVRRDVEQVSLFRCGDQTKYIIHFIWSHIQSLDPLNGYIGWCAMECCDGDEEMCFDYDEGYSQYCKAVRLVKFIFLFTPQTNRTRCNNLHDCICGFKYTDCRRRLPLPNGPGKVWSG